MQQARHWPLCQRYEISMELKRVEMIGFKSFPEKLSVEFDQGITAIIGPNGSGKSNISDAIRWVLGEQSARQLRGARMEDVIFAGTERRKPLGYAQVTLVLGNQDHKIPLAFDEIAICRRVYRSGESEYFVNNIKYRLKDIHEMLMDTGIGKDGYSVIGQGRIDQLLSTKPQERRLHEIELRLGPLEEQAKSAAKYKELEEELKVYEINSFLDQYKQYKEQFDKTEADLNALEKDLSEAEARQNEARERSQKLAAEAESAGQTVTELMNRLSQARLDKESAEGDRRLAEQEKEHQAQEIIASTDRLKDVKIKLAQRSRTVQEEEKTMKNLIREDEEKEKMQVSAREEDRKQSESLLMVGQALLKKEQEAQSAKQTLEEQERLHERSQGKHSCAAAEGGGSAGRDSPHGRQDQLAGGLREGIRRIFRQCKDGDAVKGPSAGPLGKRSRYGR